MLDPKPSYLCNMCGERKKEANHWFIVYILDRFSKERYSVECPTANLRNFCLVAWDDVFARQPFAHHVCGEGCSHKAMSQFVEHGYIQRAPNVAPLQQSESNSA